MKLVLHSPPGSRFRRYFPFHVLARPRFDLTIHGLYSILSDSTTDRGETLRRLREGLKSPPAALPLLLSRCRAGLGLKVVISAEEWGKIESMDVRLLTGDINIQVNMI